ncbi:hypothetical protein F5X68DRAFT_249101 [Plectosphaerella plurivora]|uniref:NmrA-like domain-containing protein n=1 Tax=Plectosphaerella plurivora TaxID=936078 RepID=A0A9P8V3U4_9PEZI|nr:hypothetical protein F5X68DRAFT_249101 [Plectosphaerella plurivora]
MLVLITGISGNLGQRLASAALARGLQVRGLGRNPDNVSSEVREKLESFVKTEHYYDIPALDRAVTGVDAIISAYSPDPILDLDANLLLLRAAERAGVKVFVASSWNQDWSKNKYGDMEFYDSHIAFEHQAAMTSTIKPVYFITGMFAELLLTSFGPGNLKLVDGHGEMSYYGNGNTVKIPWSTTDDIAAWTIETLINGEGVQDGKGGIFRFCSGQTTIEELAALYEKITGAKVDIIRRGSLEDLEAEVFRGIWSCDETWIDMAHVRAPTSMEAWLTAQKKQGDQGIFGVEAMKYLSR